MLIKNFYLSPILLVHLNYFVWLKNADEGSVYDMRILSLSLKLDLCDKNNLQIN